MDDVMVRVLSLSERIQREFNVFRMSQGSIHFQMILWLY
jgi:hypothetical protein